MSTCEGVQKVYDGNVPVMITLDVLQRTSIYHLTKPVRERVIRLRLLDYYMRLHESSNKEPDNKEPDNTNDVEGPTPLEVADPPMSVEFECEFECYKHKVDLLSKITARIASEIKKLSQLITTQPVIEPAEVMEDTSSLLITHVDEDTSSSLITHADVSLQPVQPEVIEVMDKPTPKFNIMKYCNRDPITGECDGDPRGHMHPF